MKKADILKRITELVSKISDEDLHLSYVEKVEGLQKRLSSTKKDALVAVYNDVSGVVDGQTVQRELDEE